MEALVIILALFWGLPIVAVILVADSRNRSRHYAWWAVALGWIGAIIAMAVVLVQSEKSPAAPRLHDQPGEPAAQPEAERTRLARDRELRQGRTAAGPQWIRHYLNECSDCTREGPACPVGRDLWRKSSA